VKVRKSDHHMRDNVPVDRGRPKATGEPGLGPGVLPKGS
jgi:hypothetical protein